MKRFLVILLMVPMLGVSQQTYVPDDNFENYLENNGMGNGIANDNYVTTSNISGVNSLDVSYLQITDLTGIEDFTALTELYCNSNLLISLDVSNNTTLTVLDCHNNQLISLDLSNNTALTYLECSYIGLSSLDVSNNTALTFLSCETNQLTNLDVSNNTALTFLDCTQNQLTSLDLSNNTALTMLMCGYNQLICLNIKNGNNYNFIYDSTTIYPLGIIGWIFYALNNPNLTCIEVDDPTWSTTNWLSSPNPNYAQIDTGVTFSNNCNNPCSSISIYEHLSNTSIFPNPTNDLITLDIKGYNGSVDIDVFDLSGRLLQTTSNTTISLKGYAKGIYVFRVSYGDRVEELKVVKD